MCQPSGFQSERQKDNVLCQEDSVLCQEDSELCEYQLSVIAAVSLQ